MFFSHHPQVLSRSEVWLMLRKENKIWWKYNTLSTKLWKLQLRNMHPERRNVTKNCVEMCSAYCRYGHTFRATPPCPGKV
jgi:hypothetical protein